MARTKRQTPSMARRIMLCAWMSCPCLEWCGGPSAVAAFVAPASGLQRLHSCSSKGGLESNDSGSSSGGLTTANRSACSMASSETAEGLGLRRNRDRVPNGGSGSSRRSARGAGSGKHKSEFVVYTGPDHEPDRELTKQQAARKDREQVLGTRIQRSVRLQKLKKKLARNGDGGVTDEVWAEAAGETVESLRRTLEEGANAKQALVVLNLGMVNSIVAGYVRSVKYGEFTKTDLVQDATMGLICAVEKFDPTRGFRFATYGQWWVRKYLNEGVQNQNRMIRIPVSLAYRISKVNRVRNELHSELGRTPTMEELASGAGCSVEQVKACLEQSALRVRSLDRLTGLSRTRGGGGGAPERGEGSIVAVDALAPPSGLCGKHGTATPQGAEFLQVSLREDLSNAFLRLLDATERECLVLRYGLLDGVPKSVEQTADIMDFCDSDDVRTISLQAMSKLRKGCLPEERKKLMSYLSLYEPETLEGGDDCRRENDQQQQQRTDGRGSSSSGSPEEKEMEPTIWDFSKHGQEELQHELSRYLRKHRIKEAREAEAGGEVGGGGGARGSAGGSGGGGKTSRKWSKGELAKGRSRKKLGTSGGNSPTANTATSNSSTTPTNGSGGGGGSGSSSRKLGSAKALALQREERRRELEMRQREREEEEERERLLRPIPVGDGAGSAVVGDLEPKPNSREATQLEHLSRLLWDGEEEPEDFVLTYGKRNGHSLQ